jgi:hypothetical protein
VRYARSYQTTVTKVNTVTEIYCDLYTIPTATLMLNHFHLKPALFVLQAKHCFQLLLLCRTCDHGSKSWSHKSGWESLSFCIFCPLTACWLSMWKNAICLSNWWWSVGLWRANVKDLPQERLKEIKSKYGKVSLGDTTVDMVCHSIQFWF